MNPLYHVLNRGVDKRKIFLRETDYVRFVHDLFVFNNRGYTENLSYRIHRIKKIQYIDIGCRYIQKTRDLLVQIHAFCLMPNHYHLLISPFVEDGISQFMKKLNMGYSKYFNEKYKRSGALWQGKYKSISIEGDPHFSWIPYYIHFNPLDLVMPEWRERGIKNPKKAEQYLKTYRWSSHSDYLGIKNFPSLTQREYLLDFFDGEKGYRESVPDMLKNFSLENAEGVTLE
ncbi:MAG: transposase [Parcubacteria group bacterium]|nr:transposase [Parcubacteria group bacterium]